MSYWHREETRPGRKGSKGRGWGGGGRWEKSNSKHDNLQVSQFQEAGWPDTLGKHLRAAESRTEQGLGR